MFRVSFYAENIFVRSRLAIHSEMMHALIDDIVRVISSTTFSYIYDMIAHQFASHHHDRHHSRGT